VSRVHHAAWIAAALLPACFHPTFDRPACGASGECPSGLVCRSDGTCAASGAGPGISDAGEVPVDGQACYGTGIVRICLAARPTAPLAYDVPARIDTGNAAMCAHDNSGAAQYCVIVATTIAINTGVRVVGPKPVVFLASDTITSTAGNSVDAGSYHFAAGTAPLPPSHAAWPRNAEGRVGSRGPANARRARSRAVADARPSRSPWGRGARLALIPA